MFFLKKGLILLKIHYQSQIPTHLPQIIQYVLFLLLLFWFSNQIQEFLK